MPDRSSPSRSPMPAPVRPAAAPRMFRSATIRGLGTRHLQIVPTLSLRIVPWVLGAIGAVVGLLGLAAAFENPVGLVFVLFGAAFLAGSVLARERLFQFDLDRRELRYRDRWQPRRQALETLDALEVIDGGRHVISRSSRAFSTWQLNLCLGAGQPERLNLLNHGDYVSLVEAGRQLSEALGVPLRVESDGRP